MNTYWEVFNRVQSKTLDDVDEFGNIYYYYYNDVDNRVNIEIRQIVDEQNNIAYVSENYDEPVKTGYQNADYSDPANPVVW
jgi:hypothetical protein